MDVQDCTGLTTLSSQNDLFTIYPNPASDRLFLKSGGAVIGATQIEVMDAIGKVVLHQNVSFKDVKDETQLDISSLPKGVYSVRVKAGVAQQTFRMIKN